MESKQCKDCKEWLPVGDYSPSPNSRLGVGNRCRPCAAAWARAFRKRNPYNVRASKFKISVEEVKVILDRRFCEICGGEAKHIDHDHSTGKIRGLLCNDCNSGIGMMRDSLPILQSAVIYLKGDKGKYGK